MRITGEVERIDGRDTARVRESIAAGEPAIITGVVERWRIYERWTEEFLREAVGGVRVRYRRSLSHVHPVISPEGEMMQLPNEEGTLNDYLTLMAGDSRVFLDANLVCLASRRGEVNQDLAHLLDDVETPDFLRPEDVDTVGLWLSGRGVQTRLHYDRNGKHNFNAQLRGEKEFVMAAPGEFHKLYPLPMTTSIYNFTRVNNFDADVEAYPLYAQVAARRGTLRQGDLLFIPAFWYHAFTHVGAMNFNINFWSDPHDVSLTAVALRNELATILLASSVAAGVGAGDERWGDFMEEVERHCLRWSPRRATADEVRAFAAR